MLKRDGKRAEINTVVWGQARSTGQSLPPYSQETRRCLAVRGRMRRPMAATNSARGLGSWATDGRSTWVPLLALMASPGSCSSRSVPSFTYCALYVRGCT